MNEQDLNEALGNIKEARLWMQVEQKRDEKIPMRHEDWQFLISRLLDAENLLDPPKEKP